MLRRRLLARFALTAATASALLALPLAATSRADSAGTLVTLIEQARANANLPPLAVRSDLTAAAQAQANRMAASHTLYHTPNLGSVICCWQKIGENVGEGGSVVVVHQMFMSSAPHRANILDPAFRQVGIGVAADGSGTLWISEIFRAPLGAPANPPPTSHPSSRPVTSVAPAVVAAPPATTAPPATPARVPPHAVSRDVPGGRPALAAAPYLTRLAAVIVVGGDPVSRLLDFALRAAPS
ncbi:MAG: CAP domain-containing protein [Acidothermus cellulolyticus]|nr:CAP domain-containing protein [Acidothermus cellulolyticus]